MSTNGELSSDGSKGNQAAIVAAMLTTLHGTGAQPKLDASGSVPKPGELLTQLAAYVESSTELQKAVEQVMARSARQALASMGKAVASEDDFAAMLRSKTIGTKTKGGTVARAFWWGFHIEISHEDLQSFLGGANAVNSIVGAIGGGVPSPAAPFIALAATFVAVALQAIGGLDRGRGVYISMLWIAPGVFVPTSVV